MKKTILLSSLVASSLLANAQTPFTLTGTSYSQNFDGITSSGLPAGWGVYTDASSSSVGTISTLNNSVAFGIFADTISCGVAITYNEGFKNYASANVVTKNATCSAQQAITNRALGIRQKGPSSAPNWDPGPAVVFKVANTTGRSNFQLSFKLQSLDTTSGKTTIWSVDYGIGSTPTTFTTVTTSPSSLVTGNYVFSNTPVTVSFGSALDNQSSNVWIRVVALTAATGPSGARRASTAIDDVSLTWGGTGISDVNTQPSAALTVLGNGTANNVTFGYSADETGDYLFGIYDITGRQIHTETLNVKSGMQQHTVNGLSLAPGMYIAKMTNSTSSAITKFIIN